MGIGRAKNLVSFEQDQRILVCIRLKIALSQEHDESLSVWRELGYQAFGGDTLGILWIAKACHLNEIRNGHAPLHSGALCLRLVRTHRGSRLFSGANAEPISRANHQEPYADPQKTARRAKPPINVFVALLPVQLNHLTGE